MIKKVLMLIPYSNIFPPMNGGMLRCFHLLRQLCKNFEVTIIIGQDTNSFEEAFIEYPELRACKIYSLHDVANHKDLLSLLPEQIGSAIRYRLWARTLKGPADSTYLAYYPILKRILQEKSFDFVLLENLSIVKLSPMIRKYQPHAHQIYDAHNVDSNLLRQLPGVSPANLSLVENLESTLAETVDSIITCSGADLDEFRQMNQRKLKGTVVPNGVECKPIPEKDVEYGKQSFSLLFVASLDYKPNQQGLIWFCEEIIDLIKLPGKNIQLHVVGKGEPGKRLINLMQEKNVIFHGMVDKVDSYYSNADIAVVPLLSGSGTRLKVLEAMAHRVPVISTSKGAEGIGYTDFQNIYIADKAADFADAILKLVENPDRAKLTGNNAYQFVKREYDWDTVGVKLAKHINGN